MSDNDIVMKQIQNRLSSNSKIVFLKTDDLHGFGNNSIIVTISNASSFSRPINDFIIMEPVQNKILQNLYNPFGTESNYKTTYAYKIYDKDKSGKLIEKASYPVIRDIADIFGDSSKEIIVRYEDYGSTFGAYGISIFEYSYKDFTYNMIGTYPPCEKLDLSKYDEKGNIISISAQMIDTVYNNADLCIGRESDCYDYYNANSNHLYLQLGYYNCSDYWFGYNNNMSYFNNDSHDFLAIVKLVDHEQNNTKYLVNCYQPIYDEKTNTLKWNALFSEYTYDLPNKFTQDQLKDYLSKNINEKLKY